jgi:excisionase family DNA binding protein
MAEHEQKRPWSSQELANAANVTDRHIRDLCAKGELSDAFKVGRAWLIPHETAERFLTERRQRRKKP